MKVFVIYPGRFHPFHKGHKSVYDYLSEKFGVDNVYISTTNVTEPEKSPFSFEEKKKMMMLTGIPEEKILNVKNNYNIGSISEQLPIDLNKDIAFFAVSEKDMTENPRFSKFTKKDGSPTYLQPLPKNKSDFKSAKDHAYLVVTPTIEFYVLGKSVTSASELRDQFKTLDNGSKIKFVTDLFGSPDKDILNIMNKKLILKEYVSKLIENFLTEDEEEDKIQKKISKLNVDLEYVRLKNIEKRITQLNKEIGILKSSNPNVDVSTKENEVDDLKKKMIDQRSRLSASKTRFSSY